MSSLQVTTKNIFYWKISGKRWIWTLSLDFLALQALFINKSIRRKVNFSWYLRRKLKEFTATATATQDPLTHWVRPGIKPASPWILVGFVTAKPHGNTKIHFFLFLFLSVLQHIVPGPGIRFKLQLQPKPQCDIAGSLTHCAGPGIEPVSWHSKDAADSIVPQRELLKYVS